MGKSIWTALKAIGRFTADVADNFQRQEDEEEEKKEQAQPQRPQPSPPDTERSTPKEQQ